MVTHYEIILNIYIYQQILIPKSRRNHIQGRMRKKERDSFKQRRDTSPMFDQTS